jgi:outer membrane protein assembly factor BamB
MSIQERVLLRPAPLGPPPAVSALPARLWPALVLLAAYGAFLLVGDQLELSTFARFISRLAAGVLLLLLLLVWWWANRRVRWRDRAYGFGLLLAGGAVAAPLCHPSVGGFGLLMGSLGVVLAAWVLAMLLLKRAAPFVQRLGLFVAVALAWVCLTLLRIDGLSGGLRPEVHWRWATSAEDLFLAERARAAEEGEASPPASQEPLSLSAGDWPGFRGPQRDGSARGARIRTDWDANPPRLVWRHRIGPGWSSLIVVGDRLFTQEQRGEQEAVVCYDTATGREVWAHEDANRFWEPTAGVGPRATPCFADGRLFALGPKGTLECLDAATGTRHWSRDITLDCGAKAPMWGFTGSPLVVGDLVLVYGGGEESKSLLAYHVSSGDLAWTAAAGQTSYSSPQLATLGGKEQVLLFSNAGLTAVAPATGKVLWEHPLPLPPSAPRSLQPHVVGKAQVLVASEADLGLALLDVKPQGGPSSRWTSRDLKPAFNDFVVHEGHAYGFDGRIFACVELEEGSRRWKGGRYGHGQVLLLPEQGLLLVVSERGELVLLRASPERHEVLGRLRALEGKCWSHPALVRGRLYVRNAEWMACYEMGRR